MNPIYYDCQTEKLTPQDSPEVDQGRETMNRFKAIFALLAATAGCASTVFAQDKPFKIGVIADMSGLYADMTGMGSVRSVELAVETFGGNLNGRKIVVVQADHQ